VLGLDAVQAKVAQVNAGESYIEDVPSERLAPLVSAGTLRATTSWDELRAVDSVLICLPTPLTEHREPDLSAVLGAAESMAQRLRAGHLIVLESTTYPGTTREEVAPVLERSGLRAGRDFHLAFSPERVDPGRVDWTTATTPKVIGGLTPECTRRAMEVYGEACETLVPVKSPEVAELTKLLENIFRGVNIALVNELAMLCDRMGIDVWDVIDAAATKPFGFMPFRPGPGLGGHCIPIDPFYLTWKAREFDMHTEFIELAGKINSQMPHFCVAKIGRALNSRRTALNGSRVLLVGVAYKADVNDTRESPATRIIDLLRAEGAEVEYHDPHVAELPKQALGSVPMDPERLAGYDVVVVVTAHRGIDWQALAESAPLVVDLRNVVPDVDGKVWRL
jgi:UDP-N-acetyl-D-glucosamine dehydrogenase